MITKLNKEDNEKFIRFIKQFNKDKQYKYYWETGKNCLEWIHVVDDWGQEGENAQGFVLLLDRPDSDDDCIFVNEVIEKIGSDKFWKKIKRLKRKITEKEVDLFD